MLRHAAAVLGVLCATSLAQLPPMVVLRTPDAAFENLLDFPFAQHYIQIPSFVPGTLQSLRMHYLDEGNPLSESTVLLMHGEPSWSYLYRYMIPVLVAGGHRVIVPDLIGFGRSDKPSEQTDYTFARHILWTKAFMEQLDLQHVTMFAQDWGSLIGLRLVTDDDLYDRFDRVVIGNGGLPTGGGASPAFLAWVNFAQNDPEFAIGDAVIQNGTVTLLSPAIVAAYNAPFPSEEFKAGARVFPALVPIEPDQAEVTENLAAWDVLDQYTKPFLTLFSDSDPITSGGQLAFQLRVPGAIGQPHTIITGGGHFLQEDSGPQIASLMNAWMLSPLQQKP